MIKNLIIVESPAKAKTIESYSGSDYQVVSCNGHIRDLPKRSKGVDVQHGFLPVYEISEGKRKIVQVLKKLANQAEYIYLASDDDREGESISWHLKEALELRDDKIKRIVFREITKSAIMHALAHPRGIDLDLVSSQQARRILDRLVGYDLSPLLWKKVKPGLSAGRVQSVAVRLVVEKERAIYNFKFTAYFTVVANLLLKGGQLLLAELPERLNNEAIAEQFLVQCQDAIFTIKDLEKKLLLRAPAPPFITSTLQQEASRKLGYSVARTMVLAQQLYETGKISYMRTDSVHLSKEAIASLEQEIKKMYGDEYVQLRTYTTKSTTSQEAHEAIRPTNFSELVVSDNKDEQRLYELIWKRTLSSQMADAQLEKTIIKVGISTSDKVLISSGEIVKFEGFLKAYSDVKEDGEDKSVQEGHDLLLPPLEIGEKLNLDYMKSREKFTRPPVRYTEATLVRDLEEREIGRPSTYVPIITTIQKRGYVIKESREGQPRKYQLLKLQNNVISKEILTEIVGKEKNKLFPTDTAFIVNDFLVKYFTDVTDYGFTAQIEQKLDKIAHGNKAWDVMLTEFYNVFYPKVEQTSHLDRSLVNTSRMLGVDPVTNEPIIVRLGRYGPIVQFGNNESKTEEEKKSVRFSSLKPNQHIETITLEEALELFQLPKEIGVFEEKPMIINRGRFGPYIKHDGIFYAISREDDVCTLTCEKAIVLIQEKRKKDAERFIKKFSDNSEVQILNGRWGPYIKYGKHNVRIPKEVVDPRELTLEACMELIEHKLKLKKNRQKDN